MKAVNKNEIPPSIEQTNTIKAISEDLKIAMPTVTNEADARFVIEELRHRQRQRKRLHRAAGPARTGNRGGDDLAEPRHLRGSGAEDRG